MAIKQGDIPECLILEPFRTAVLVQEVVVVAILNRITGRICVAALLDEFTYIVGSIQEGLDQCNLCRDTLIITYPNTRDFWFRSTEDLFRRFRIKSAVEDNIKSHGGYMIDEWQYVDERQIPIDLRARVRFQPEEGNQ